MRLLFVPGLTITIILLLSGCTDSPHGDRRAAETAGKQAKTKVTAIRKEPRQTARGPGNSGGNKPSAGKKTTDADLEGAEPQVLITGHVLLADGMPASSATLTLSGYDITESGWEQVDAGQTTASEDGSYRLVGRGLRNHTVRAEHEKGGAVSIRLKEAGQRFNFDTPLPQLRRFRQDLRLGQYAEIRGRVVDESDKPVAGASLTFKGDDLDKSFGTQSADGHATSSATGEFVLKSVVPGQRTLLVSSENHVPASQLVTTPSTKEIVIRLASAGATLQGHVLRKNSATPVTSATVQLVYDSSNGEKGVAYKPFKTYSDQNGAYKIPLLPPGRFRINSTAVEQRLGMVPGDHLSGLMIQINDRETTELNLFMYGGATVTGRVYDKETDEPIADANIRSSSNNALRKGDNGTTSAADGTFELSGVFPYYNNTAQLTVKRPGYSVVSPSLWNRGVLAAEIDPLSDLGRKNIPMMRTVSISGTVRTKDGTPVPTAKVTLWEAYGGSNHGSPGVPVASDGTYKLEVSRFTTVRVMAEAPSYAAEFSEQAKVDNEDVTKADIVLEPGGMLSGIVSGPDGFPVEGSDVSLRRSIIIGNSTRSYHLPSAVSGPDGVFTMSNLPKTFKAQAKKEGYASSRQEEISIEPNGIKSDVKLQLRHGHFIAGRALNSAGDPVPKASISVSSSEPGEMQSAHATTDNEGRYRVENLADVTYLVYGHASEGGSSKQLEGIRVGRSDVDLIFDQGEKRTLVGKVVDDRSGEPIKDFTVSNIGRPKKESNPGGFTVPGLSPGTNYSASIEAPGYATTIFQVVVPRDKASFEQEFRLGPGGIVAGRAVRLGTGQPLANVLITVWPGSSNYYHRSGTPVAFTKTNEDGTFRLPGVPAGEAQLQAKPSLPLAESTRKAIVKNYEVKEVGDWELAGGSAIQGRVVRNGDIGVEGSTIDISNYSPQVRKSIATNRDGTFHIGDLPAGDYGLSVIPHGVSKSVKLGPEEIKEVIIHLGGSRLSGRVTRSGRGISAHVSVSYTAQGPDGNQNKATQTDSDGNYTLTDLLPGRVNATSQVPGQWDNRRSHELTLSDGEETTQNFELPDGRVTGIVLDSTGAPVPTAHVALTLRTANGSGELSPTGTGKTAKTDSTGKFQFEGLEAGTYSVTASKEGAGLASKGNLAVTDQTPAYAELRLSGEGGTLESVALNIADGKPIPSAWCYLIGPEGQLSHAEKRNAEGLLTIENIPPGSYRVQVSAWSFSVSEKNVEIRKGETTRIEDVLYGAGLIQWTIQDRTGNGIAGAKVSIVPLDANSIEQPRTGSTDSKGSFTARGLAAGTYSALAEIPDRPSVTEQFEVKVSGHAVKKTEID